MPDHMKEKPAFPQPSPARTRAMTLIGAALFILLIYLTVYFSSDLLPPPGSNIPIASVVVHWLVILALIGLILAFVVLPRTLFGNAEGAMTDDEVILRERRKMKLAKAAVPVVVLLVLLLRDLSIYYFPGTAALQKYWPAIFVILLLVGAIFLAPSRRAYTQPIQRKRLEEFQMYNLFGLGWAVVFAGVACFPAMPWLENRAKFICVLIVLVLIQFSTIVVYGYGWLRPCLNPARDDEWARQLRARTARIGYLTAMFALGAIYLVWLYVPQSLSLAIRSALFAAVAFPATAYLFLDWRAGG